VASLRILVWAIASVMGARSKCRPKVRDWMAYFSPMPICDMQGNSTTCKEVIWQRGWSTYEVMTVNQEMTSNKISSDSRWSSWGLRYGRTMRMRVKVKQEVRGATQWSYTQKAQHKYQNGSTFLMMSRNYTMVKNNSGIAVVMTTKLKTGTQSCSVFASQQQR